MNPINITEECYTKVADLLAEENNPALALRVFVQGGGCSGFQYGFTFDDEQAEDDFVIEERNIKVLVDSMSYQYLVGSTVDYKEGPMGSSFVINNPGAKTQCGCGSSFSA
jgi:iron-sulfur cluster insertion protein